MGCGAQKGESLAGWCGCFCFALRPVFVVRHRPRSVYLWSYIFRLGRNRPTQLKNGRGFTQICIFHHTADTVWYRTGIVRPYGVCTNPVALPVS